MLTYIMIIEKIRELGNVPDDLSIKFLHVILSHHGEIVKGWGSPVIPQIPEAVALHYADDLDTKVKASFKKIAFT